MKTYCTNPNCSQPHNTFPDLDDRAILQTAQQKHCDSCGMPQILAGRYISQELLGKGGFGAAYLACDRHTTKLRQCVVKQFQPSDQFNERTLKTAEELFSREAEVLETLGNQHPQIPELYAFFPLIVPVEDTGEEKEFFYIVQQFIDGETLEQEVETKGKFREEEVREVLETMLKVLEFVHDHNSIHRDIKPSNIMRDREGKLYLLDFGAVKRVTTGEGGSKRSTGIYSMGFAPPEQMQGRQVYPSTDLYALAGTCIRLATGKPIQELYDSYNNQWSWRSHCDIGDQLAQVLDKMLLPTPKQRFPSAQAALRVLQEETASSQDSGISTPNLNLGEKPAFSQPADWRSLLSTSEPENQEEESSQSSPKSPLESRKWEALLSLSEESEQEHPEASSNQEETTVTSPQDSSSSEPENNESFPPTQTQDSEPSDRNETFPEQTELERDNASRTPSSRLASSKLLANVGFTVLEGGLLFIALRSLFSSLPISMGLWGMSMGGLIYLQWKGWLTLINSLIIAGITIAVAVLVLVF
jgi:serine/threonine-protein kinase